MPASPPIPAQGAAKTPAVAITTGPAPVAAPWWQQWVTPLVILATLTLFLNQQNRAFDAVNKRIDVLLDVLREDVQAVREDLRASEKRQQEDLARLEGKVDRLLESR
ncbi:MAG: hypothetical protein TE42_06075 [Candidatus Synechococcus spongiarum SP3]|uniref:Uncharacterized protein n=1 Tax=Candidatus Synechococcus spongiarum SP3 TaxID=1604020 RepID=A0A0G2HLP2_9SYNE|nr:MAG: hypothetical protein TE42_06075 [Candidatus Synechococcus spongiarum SP3]